MQHFDYCNIQYMENEIIQQSTPKQKWVTFLTHFVCLGVLFFLPEVVMNINSPRHDGIPTGIYIKFVVYIIVFYLNYYLIIDRCLNKKNSTYKIIGYNALVLIGAIVVLYITWRLTAADHPMHIESNHQPFPESLPMTKPGEVPPPPPHELMTQPGEMQHFIQALTTILRDVIILIILCGVDEVHAALKGVSDDIRRTLRIGGRLQGTYGQRAEGKARHRRQTRRKRDHFHD